MNLLFDKLNKCILSNSYSISSLYTVGAALCINFALGTIFVDLSSFNVLNCSLTITLVLFISLLLNKFWHPKLKTYICNTWRFCLVLGLLFIPSYIFFVHDFHVLWLCNLILSALLYIVMSNIIIGLSFITIVGYLGYLSSSILYCDDSLIKEEFASLSCFTILISIVIQICDRYTVSKAASKKTIHELKKIITKRTEEYKKALNVKHEFLKQVSTKIRTPIHKILGSSDEHDSWYKWSDERKRQFLKETIDNKKQLIIYASNMLNLASLQEKKFNLNIKKKVSIFELAKNEINKITPLIIKQNKNLNIKLKTIILKPAIIECDPLKISQVIYSLLKNAIIYSEYGTIKLSIKTTENHVRITISDEGIGVPDDDKLEILTPFFKNSKTKGLTIRKGLELSIAQRIIVLHNSTIQIKDNKPKGSIFTFSLPYKHLNP